MGIFVGLRVKLFASSVVILILVLMFTGAGLLVLRSASQQVNDLYQVYNKGLQDLQTIGLNLYKVKNRSSQLALSYKDSRMSLDIQSVKYDMEGSIKSVNEGLEDFLNDVDEAHRSEGTKDLLVNFKNKIGEWSTRVSKEFNAMGTKAEFEVLFFDGATAGLYDDITGTIDSLSAEMVSSSQSAYQLIKDENSISFFMFMGFAVLVLLLVVVIAYIQNRVIVRPILKVHGRLKAIAQGEADLTQTLEVKSRDEVGQICSDFNSFLLLLKEIVWRVKENVTRTEAVAETLHGDSIEVASSLNEINSNNQGISRNILSLDSQLGDASLSTVTPKTSHLAWPGRLLLKGNADEPTTDRRRMAADFGRAEGTGTE